MGDNCYVTEDANWAVVKARLLAAGHTVTTGGFPASLAGFQQFWDMRYNTALTAADRALLIPFITNGGYAFLQTENAGFVARNNSVAELITDMGGGTTTIGAIGNADQVSDEVNGLYITPGTVIHFNAIAAIVNSQGRWMVKDASDRIQVMAWVGRAGDLSPGVTGTILTIPDINWLDPNYYTVTNVAALDDIIRGIVAGTVSGTIGANGNNSSAAPPPVNTEGFPMEWKTGYRLWMKDGKLGFNNGGGDLYGVDENIMSQYSGGWVFVTATFHNTIGGSTYVNRNELYLNGKQQTLSQQLGSPTAGTAGLGITLANHTNPSANPNYEFAGDISEVFVYNRKLSATEVMQMYYATRSRYPNPPPTTTTTSTTTSTTTTTLPPPSPLPPGIPATNSAWGGNGFGPLAYPGTFVGYRGGYSASNSHEGNAGGASASPLGGNGPGWAGSVGSAGAYGEGASGGGYTTVGTVNAGGIPGYNSTTVNATGVGNGGGGVETDGVNSGTAPINGGNGTGGLLRIIITSGTYTFTNTDLTTFGATRLTDSGKGIEWDHSTSTNKRASANLYEHALLATFTVPAGVTQISVGIIAGGGGGATGPCVNAGGGGGGAGLLTNYPVTQGTTYKIKVGAGGRGGTQPTDRGSAGGPPYGVTDAPWRGGRTAFCKADDTEIIYATGGNTRPDSCAQPANNSDSASANTRD